MKQITVNVYGLSTMCRLCLKRGVNVLDIFCFSARLRDQVADVVMKCAPVKIRKHDEMPNFICQLCYTQLEKMHRFQMQVVRCEKTLRRYLKQLYASDTKLMAKHTTKKLSDDSVNQNFDAGKIVKCESSELHNAFDTNINCKEETSSNFDSAGNSYNQTSLKAEIKNEPMDDNSEIPFKGDDHEDSKVKKTNVSRQKMARAHVTPANGFKESLKSEIKDEPMDDNTEFPDDAEESYFGGSDRENLCKDIKDTDVRSQDMSPAHVTPANDLKKSLKPETKNEPMDDNTEFPDDAEESYFEGSDLENLCKDIKDTDVRNQDMSPAHVTPANDLKRSLKPETKNEPMDDNTEFSDDAEESYFEGSDRENLCKDIKDTEVRSQDMSPAYVTPANKLEKSLKPEIKDEPMDDNSEILTKCNDSVESFSKGDRSEISSEHALGIVKSPRSVEEKNKNLSVNHEKHKKDKRNSRDTEDLKKQHQCDICNKILKTSFRLKRHMFLHSGEKPHQCDVCSKRFALVGNLNKHAIIHTGKKPYQCNVCNNHFSSSRSLKRHTLLHTGEKPYQCDVCNKGFNDLAYLKIHKRQKHTDGKLYQCSNCDKAFHSSNHLKRHLLVHTGEKSHKCDICNSSFADPYNLKKHKLAVHAGEKKYQCDVCNKCFSLSSNLTAHKRIHTGEKSYQCDICNKGFNCKTNLKVHKRIHTGEKPYKCDICNRCFTTLTTFNNHKLKHTGEKPYQCEDCDKCFTDSGSLNRHKLIHTGEKPFQCDVCYRYFNLKTNLTRHKRRHNSEKL